MLLDTTASIDKYCLPLLSMWWIHFDIICYPRLFTTGNEFMESTLVAEFVHPLAAVTVTV